MKSEMAWHNMELLSFKIYYSPTLFKTMGLDYNMQLAMSGVLNVAQVCGGFPSHLSVSLCSTHTSRSGIVVYCSSLNACFLIS